MRRMHRLIVAILLVACFVFGVSAATGASFVSSHATVSSDGSCQVTVTATIRLEGSENVTFPVPGNASNITLNGSHVRTTKQDDVRRINLSKVLANVVGDFSISINYTLRDVIETDANGMLILQIPVLCGFSHPVEKMEFSITLPAEIPTQPSFYSGYHQADIEKHMQYTVSGATVSGSFLKALKDHETLIMTMSVTEQMFPQSILKVQDVGAMGIAAGVCAGIALLYWLIFLWHIPPKRQHFTAAPEGFTAGQMGCVLNGQGVDLCTMVLTWAQLGYVLIQVNRNGHVLLHKRMDMGNERSETETYCFKKMFGRGYTVNTYDEKFAVLCKMMEKRPGEIRELMHRRTGNLRVFRALGAAAGLFGGIIIGMSLSGGAVLQGFLAFLFAIAGAVSAWIMQGWAISFLLMRKRELWSALGCAGVWLVFGLISGAFTVALWMVTGLMLAGILLAFGGRRTPAGRQTFGQVLDLRRYLRTVPKSELQRICALNPEYFFQLAPYALALGSIKRFARRFGAMRLPGCPYLTTGKDGHMTAEEWAGVMETAVEGMRRRSRQLPMEKFMALLQSLRR